MFYRLYNIDKSNNETVSPSVISVYVVLRYCGRCRAQLTYVINQELYINCMQIKLRARRDVMSLF